jgi:transcriptional regulator with XRE-family HTH domain
MHQTEDRRSHDPQQKRVRELVELMLEATGMSPTELAREAGLSASTLTRFLHDREAKHVLSTRSLSKLSLASGVPLAMASDILTKVDPAKLQRALRLADKAIGSAKIPDREAVRSEIAAVVYEWLDEREKRGIPVRDDEEMLTLVNSLLRRFRDLLRKPSR